MSPHSAEQAGYRSAGEREPSVPRPRGAAQRHRRLRYLYFGLASGWGFVAGSVAVLAGLDALGQTASLTGALGVRVAVAAVVALVGGIVVSLAYREAVHRAQ